MVQSALTFGLTVTGGMDVFEHLFGSGHYSISLFPIIWYVSFGLISGFSAWNSMEGKYQNALLARVNASPK